MVLTMCFPQIVVLFCHLNMFNVRLLMPKLNGHFSVNIISCGVWSVPVFRIGNYSIFRYTDTQINRFCLSHKCIDGVWFSFLIKQIFLTVPYWQGFRAISHLGTNLTVGFLRRWTALTQSIYALSIHMFNQKFQKFQNRLKWWGHSQN